MALREYVESGLIEIGDKSLEAILSDFVTLLDEFTADMAVMHAHGEDGMLVDLDYRKTLWKYAEREADSGHNEIAVTFYGLWIEHTANGCLIRGLERQGYGPETIKPLIRTYDIKTKITALWNIAGFPPLSTEGIRIAGKIAQARNSFVHYKYPRHSESAHETARNQLGSILERASDLKTAFDAAMNTFYWDGREDEVTSFIREKFLTEFGEMGKYIRRRDQPETDS
jgi:hypothetical protein